MSYWAGYGLTGILLNQTEFEDMLKIYKEKNPEETDIEDIIESDGIDCIRFIMSKFAGESISEYNGKVMSIIELSEDSIEGVRLWPFYKPDGSMNVNQKLENGEWEYAIHEQVSNTCYVIKSDKDMCSPLAFETKPYDSYQDFVQEFKDKLENYLPDNFDWDAHLGFILYAAYA